MNKAPWAKPRIALAVMGSLMATGGWASAAELVLRAYDSGTKERFPARVHLKGPDGKPVRAPDRPFHRDHFTFPGEVVLELAPGNYSYEVEHGPQYSMAQGTFELREGSKVLLNTPLRRLIDLNAEGWWSGDLHVHRPLEHMPLLLRAEELAVAPVITWWNNRNPWVDRSPPKPSLQVESGRYYYDVMAGEDEREGGALLYFHLGKTLPLQGSKREYPSPVTFLRMAREQEGAWVDIEKPFWWDVPVWVATGQVDSIGIANNHQCRSQMFGSTRWGGEAWGRPRDLENWPDPLGNGYYSQELYYRLLEAGVRLPPSAGSASGVLPNPLGYNRVWVHLGPQFDYHAWWEGLRAGRSFVSNGPFLRVKAADQWPGHAFRMDGTEPLVIPLEGDLFVRPGETVKAIEILLNGKVLRRVQVTGNSFKGSLGTLTFDEPGWFLVRAITDHPDTFRFAATAPWHVEGSGAERRISRQAATFFRDWVRERRARVKLEDAGQRAEVLQWHDAAAAFWEDQMATATAP